MNFGSTLYVAQNNATQKSNEVRCYKTTFSPPKKEPPKKRTLSANIQKFLARQEEEKRLKEIAEKKKRDELLSLRSQDKMSVKRVSTMLKRTKSANKSVMEDAVDDVNTVVTMAGPSQCDEDDYGYVSQEASSFYNKLMDKYSNMPPEEDKFSKAKKVVIKDLNAAKERVKATLNRIEEEEMMPRKRKRKSKEEKNGVGEDDNFIDDEIKYRDKDEVKKEEEEPKPKKPKRPAPPPMDFSQLLKIAEQKQHEPVIIEKKQTEDEDDKPMTKKQRLEYLREKEARIQRERRELEGKLQPKKSLPSSSTSRQHSPSLADNNILHSRLSSSSTSSQPKINRNGTPSIPRIPKLNQSSESGSKSSRPSLESAVDRLQSHKIPKLSDRIDVKKPSSSSLISKPVPPPVAEEMLKKSGKVWSKPCNLSVPNSPSHKVANKISNCRDDKRRDSLDSHSSISSSHLNIDRRKDILERQGVRKPSLSCSTSSPSLDSRKELNNNVDKEKLKDEIERKKLLIKQKLANERNHSSDRKDERSNRNDSQSIKKTDTSNIIKNGIHRNSLTREDERLQQKSKSDGELNKRSKPNNDAQSKPGVKKIVDLFGDDFPNEDERKSNSTLTSASKSTLGNGFSKLPGKPVMKTSLTSKEHDERLNKSLSQSSRSVDSKSKLSASSAQNSRHPLRPDDKNISNNRVQSRQFPPSDLKSKSHVSDKARSSDLKPRQFPPTDVKPRQFPPPDMRPRQFPPPDVRRRPKPLQRRPDRNRYDDEDEEEYDSEMDDFIDDDEEAGGEFDYSSQISQIFGYDKKRYASIDDDDIEEANFAQLMKEEVRSTRIGIQEDLEEFLKEKAEKKRLQQRKLQKLAEMKKKRR